MESGKGAGPVAKSVNGMCSSRQTLLWVLLPVLLFSLFSCKTPPVLEDAPDLGLRLKRSGQSLGEGVGRFDRLGNTALVYAWMDVAHMAPLMDSLVPSIPDLDRRFVTRGRDMAFAAYPVIKKDDSTFSIWTQAGNGSRFGMTLSHVSRELW